MKLDTYKEKEKLTSLGEQGVIALRLFWPFSRTIMTATYVDKALQLFQMPMSAFYICRNQEMFDKELH